MNYFESRIINLLLGIGSVALLIQTLKRSYPQQTVIVMARLEDWNRAVNRYVAYSNMPTWLQEMAEVRGLKPGDDSETISDGGTGAGAPERA